MRPLRLSGRDRFVASERRTADLSVREAFKAEIESRIQSTGPLLAGRSPVLDWVNGCQRKHEEVVDGGVCRLGIFGPQCPRHGARGSSIRSPAHPVSDTFAELLRAAWLSDCARGAVFSGAAGRAVAILGNFSPAASQCSPTARPHLLHSSYGWLDHVAAPGSTCTNGRSRVRGISCVGRTLDLCDDGGLYLHPFRAGGATSRVDDTELCADGGGDNIEKLFTDIVGDWNAARHCVSDGRVAVLGAEHSICRMASAPAKNCHPSPAHPRAFSLVKQKRPVHFGWLAIRNPSADKCGPRGLKGTRSELFHSNGDDTFTDVTAESGVAKTPAYYCFTALAGDFDNNGRPDIYVACDSTPSMLFH